MNASHFQPNLRDVEFNLFELFRIQDASLGKGPFASFNEELARDVVRGVTKLSQAALAPSWAECDRHPPVFDGAGKVTVPEALARSIAAFQDGGFDRMALPERLGGMGAPPSLDWAAFEQVAGAHSAVAFYLFGNFMARTIDRLGTESQRKRFCQPMVERRWGASMVLTEPDAGSDVGAGRARARHVAGDLYEIEGVKRFITNGEYDSVENIVHMVLARPEGAGPGTKGLSMFIVPKIWVNEDGSLGELNGVRCAGLEKKMGIKASVTCELVFGDGAPARGFLVGDKHDGIRQMFHVIEQARMAVGVKSMATLSTAYLNALEYAKTRVQGPDLVQATDKTAPRVAILKHPDVRRMLMDCKSHAEGMRALCLFTATMQDQVELLGGHDAEAAREADRLNDLLLPLVKGYCSDRAPQLLAQALQVFGGNGYMQDYPLEQYLRDQKIDSLYEGTTHIQALDLTLRKIARDGGETLQALLARVRATLERNEGGDALAPERALLSRALADVEGMLFALMNKFRESLYYVGLNANRVLYGLAELVIGWLLVRQGAIAEEKRATASEADRAFYEGKLAAVRHFCRSVLPGLTLSRKLVESSTLELMDVPEAAF